MTILGAHKQEGHGDYCVCPITKMTEHPAEILFVDDTDLIYIDMSQDEITTQTRRAMQNSTDNWGELLIASGGVFKPEKCFPHLISFKWYADGRWKYEANEEDGDLTCMSPC